MSYLPEVEAWLEIAIALEASEVAHSPGLCIELCYMTNHGAISRALDERMYGRVNAHMECQQALGDDSRGYAFPTGDVGVRVLAAYFLALDAADEILS